MLAFLNTSFNVCIVSLIGQCVAMYNYAYLTASGHHYVYYPLELYPKLCLNEKR